MNSIRGNVSAAVEQLHAVPPSMEQAEANRGEAHTYLTSAINHLKEAYSLIDKVGTACDKTLSALASGELCVQVARGHLETVTANDPDHSVIGDIQDDCESLESDFSRASQGLLWDTELPSNTLQALATVIDVYEDDLLNSLLESQEPIAAINGVVGVIHQTAVEHLDRLA